MSDYIHTTSDYAKLDPKVKKMWLKALRSGDYRQGKNFLAQPGKKNEGDKFCCLGVLCDIARSKGVIDAPELEDADDADREIQVYYYDGDNSTDLPTAVYDWAFAGYPYRYSLRGPLDPTNELIEMNDNGKKFTTIANWIEENL